MAKYIIGFLILTFLIGRCTAIGDAVEEGCSIVSVDQYGADAFNEAQTKWPSYCVESGNKKGANGEIECKAIAGSRLMAPNCSLAIRKVIEGR